MCGHVPGIVGGKFWGKGMLITSAPPGSVRHQSVRIRFKNQSCHVWPMGSELLA